MAFAAASTPSARFASMGESSASLKSQISDAAAAISAIANQIGTLTRIAEAFCDCFARGGTLYLCGNGGSAADAQHVAAEFTGRFLRERRPLPAIALTTNTSTITAIANDYDYSEVFARQVLAHATPNDCVIGISTSGRSTSITKALSAARSLNVLTIGFTGAHGEELAALSDHCFMAPSSITPRIQEAHLVAWHLVCDVVDERMTKCKSGSTGTAP